MLTAAATTHSVNSSREPVRATCQSSHGKKRRPTTSIRVMNAATASTVLPSVSQRLPLDGLAPNTSASGGSKTRTSTIARSSTTSQPTAIRPLADSTALLLSSALSSTTVLATDRETPNTIAPPTGQPH